MVQASAVAKGIHSLYHFTRIENLSSILQNGLLQKNYLTQNIPGALCNDPLRIDGTDAVCATIGFPNYKMWHGLKCDSPNAEWVLLVLKSEVLWERDCAFCKTNAASGSVTAIP